MLIMNFLTVYCRLLWFSWYMKAVVDAKNNVSGRNALQVSGRHADHEFSNLSLLPFAMVQEYLIAYDGEEDLSSFPLLEDIASGDLTINIHYRLCKYIVSL